MLAVWCTALHAQQPYRTCLTLLVCSCCCAGLYKADDWSDAVDKARRLVEFGGHGHTSCLYTSSLNKEHIAEFRSTMETVRILINSPASQG